jgi:hypothetical protein
VAFCQTLPWTSAKSLGKETLKTGSQLLSDLTDKPDVSAHNVIAATAQELVKIVRGAGKRCRKCKNRTEWSKKKILEPK